MGAIFVELVAGVVVVGGELEAGAGVGAEVEGAEEAVEAFVLVGFSGSARLFFVLFEGKHIWGKSVLADVSIDASR